MPSQPSIKTLGDLLEALTKEIPFLQQSLNHDFLDRANEFAPVFQAVKGTVFENLALTIAPMHSILDRVDIETSFRVTESQAQQTSLSVQPLNIGFSRRFAYSSLVQNRLQISVQKILPESGKDSSNNSST